ncbi:MAG: hypothetical protein EOS11_22690 [Mesorhizobium sp.]|nr:MAG: hypothetical protein EOQ33_20625 [Mesorhizobium sp.]RWO25686.1 MAG: hypothetical protein EOS10_29845 [Mesorhizobium sp.]RWO39052.1 MAG: hypothetical protein EOS11_22690 [Mesorhizobium sp.]TIN75543.1 MAG: hypothetical protein E5Y09_26930 [Mesorhizobium sp.]
MQRPKQSCSVAILPRPPLACPLATTWHLPTRGRSAASAPRLFCGVGDWRKPCRHPISPLVGEMSGRTEGGAVPPACHFRALAPPSADPTPFSRRCAGSTIRWRFP